MARESITYFNFGDREFDSQQPIWNRIIGKFMREAQIGGDEVMETAFIYMRTFYTTVAQPDKVIPIDTVFFYDVDVPIGTKSFVLAVGNLWTDLTQTTLTKAHFLNSKHFEWNAKEVAECEVADSSLNIIGMRHLVSMANQRNTGFTPIFMQQVLDNLVNNYSWTV